MTRWAQLTIVLSIVALSGCGPATSNRAIQDDKNPLNSAALYDLVSGNSLRLSAYDFSGTVYFSESGLLSAVDNENQRDVGTWDITDGNQLCLKFRVWYYGDTKCYSLLVNDVGDRLSFFTPNGAAYYIGIVEQGDAAGLENNFKEKSVPKSVRQDLARQKAASPTGTPPARQEIAKQQDHGNQSAEVSPNDADQTVKRLAGNCPGCNMAGIDLKEASLIKANLQGANLAGADLRYANLRRANLAGANLSGALLNHANLPGADLSGANLSNADLSGANLLLTNFTGAEVSGTILSGANLEKTIGLKKQP